MLQGERDGLEYLGRILTVRMGINMVQAQQLRDHACNKPIRYGAAKPGLRTVWQVAAKISCVADRNSHKKGN